VERLTPEQIRLLEELRELRDSGILTVDEFEFQVAKVLGRPLLVEPSPVNEEPVTPDETVAEEISDEARREEQDVVNGVPAASDETQEAELLEYEFVESATSDFTWLLVEENQFVESLSTSDIPAENIAEAETQQNKSSRRKVLIGTTVSLVLVIALFALGGGKSDSTSSQIIDGTTIVAQSTIAATTQAPATSTTTTTEVIPTTTYEVLQCPYTRVIEAVDGKLVTPEGITFEVLPTTYKSVPSGDGGYAASIDKYVPYKFGDIEVRNPADLRLRIGMEVRWSWADDSVSVSWEPDNGRGFLNGFDSRVIQVPRTGIFSVNPVTNLRLEMVNATIKYLCP
jgi:hypothetical protein